MTPIGTRRGAAVAVAACLGALPLFATGCDEADFVVGIPGDGASRAVTFQEFQERLESGVSRVEIALQPGGPPFFASEVELGTLDNGFADERVRSRITGVPLLFLTETDCSGRFVLALGGIEVAFGAGTTFVQAGTEVACRDFVERVQTDLQVNRQPALLATRPPFRDFVTGDLVPQAPSPSAVFGARAVGDEPGEDRLALNVDRAHLLVVGRDIASCREHLPDAPAGCIGVLRVLNAFIGILTGTTRLRAPAAGP